MAELVEVPLTSIDPNPYRLLATYPFNERKIETLKRSIADVGVWERVIARPHGNRYQMAFGHHLVEAAKRKSLKTITVIVRRELDDAAMLRFMARENAEEFNADFLVMLEMWEAAAKHLAAAAANKPQAIAITRFLGWTVPSGKGQSGGEKMNETARACNAALALITAYHLSRDDLRDMSIKAAREIVERTLSRIELTERLGAKTGRPAKEIEQQKKVIAGAARSVAREWSEGGIGIKNIRSEIDYRAVKTATAKDKASPLFAAFAKEVAEQIHKMLVDDRTAERLSEMEKALPLVELEDDHRALRRIDFALAEHEDTTSKWRSRLKKKGEKVIPFKLLKGGFKDE